MTIIPYYVRVPEAVAPTTGTINVNVTPDNGQGWVLTGPSYPGGLGGNGDATFPGVDPGTYDIIFIDDQFGFIQPVPDSVVLAAEGDETLVGVYTARSTNTTITVDVLTNGGADTGQTWTVTSSAPFAGSFSEGGAGDEATGLTGPLYVGRQHQITCDPEVGFTTPTPGPITPTEAGSDEFTCDYVTSGTTNRDIVAGWSVLDPTTGQGQPDDSLMIYCSESNGSDGNDGLTTTTPKQSVAAALALARDGYPDHVHFLRGDEWKDPDFTLKHGKSRLEPIVLTSYSGVFGTTTADERPTFDFSLSTSSWPNSYALAQPDGRGLNYNCFVDLKFVQRERDPDDASFVGFGNSGIFMANYDTAQAADHTYQGCLFEGCEWRWWQRVYTFHIPSGQPYSYGDLDFQLNRLTDFVLRRCCFTECYQGSGEGKIVSYRAGNDIVMEEVLWHQIWWPRDRNDIIPADQNHHITYNQGCQGVLFKDNIMWHTFGQPAFKHSANGLTETGTVNYQAIIPAQYMPAGSSIHFDGCVAVAASGTFFTAAGNNEVTEDRWEDIKFIDNLFVAPGLDHPEGKIDVRMNPIATQDTEGTEFLQINNNVLVWGSTQSQEGNLHRLFLYQGYQADPSPGPCKNLEFKNNIVHGLNTRGGGIMMNVEQTWRNATVTGNTFHMTDTDPTAGWMFRAPETLSTFNGNHWYSVQASQSDWFQSGDYTSFKAESTVNVTADATLTVPTWTDDTVTIEDYHETVLGAGTGDMREMGRYIRDRWQRYGPDGGWDTDCTADSIQTYFRDGFTKV